MDQQLVTVTGPTGTSEARVIKRLGPEVLVEVTLPAIGIARGDRLVVARQRIAPVEEA